MKTPISIMRNAGIMIYGTFVFGYDHDTVESFDAAVDFAIRNRFYLANFNPLTPTPGAPLYDRLQEEGRLIHDRWWIDAGFRYGQATFHPRNMTAQQLTDGCYRARTRFNTVRLSDSACDGPAHESSIALPIWHILAVESHLASRDPRETESPAGWSRRIG